MVEKCEDLECSTSSHRLPVGVAHASRNIYPLVYSRPASRAMYCRCLSTNARFARTRNNGRAGFLSKQDMNVGRAIVVGVGSKAEINGPCSRGRDRDENDAMGSMVVRIRLSIIEASESIFKRSNNDGGLVVCTQGTRLDRVCPNLYEAGLYLSPSDVVISSTRKTTMKDSIINQFNNPLHTPCRVSSESIISTVAE